MGIGDERWCREWVVKRVGFVQGMGCDGRSCRGVFGRKRRKREGEREGKNTIFLKDFLEREKMF